MIISPARITGDPYKFLNARDHSFVCSPDFVNVQKTGTCPGYQSMDPRTVDSPRAIRTTFDRPPLQSRNTQPLDNLYRDPGLHTGFYRSYQDIHGGNIFYYTDAEQADPYSTDPYVLTSYTLPEIEIDPMGGLSPIYQKVPMLKNNRYASPYTFDQDQMQFREDLMSLQSRQINKSDYLMYNMFHQPSQFSQNITQSRFVKKNGSFIN